MRFISKLSVVSILSIFINLVRAAEIEKEVNGLVTKIMAKELETITTEGKGAFDSTKDQFTNALKINTPPEAENND